MSLDLDGNISAEFGNSGKKGRKRRGAAANLALQQALMMHVRGGTTSAVEVRQLLIGEFSEPNVPSERTIRDMIADLSARDTSEEWTLVGASLDQIALVAPVWAEARTKGFGLTKTEAEWVLRMRTASPDLSLHNAWALAMMRARWPEEGKWIDMLVVFEPYRDAKHCERYFAAANAGYIEAPDPACVVALGPIKEAGQPLGPEAEKCTRRNANMREISMSEAIEVDPRFLSPAVKRLLEQVAEEGIDG